MNKKIFLSLLVVVSCTVMADDEFLVIKGDYHYAKDVPFNGAKYDGYVDANGKPYLFGMVHTNADYVYTQIKNGIPNGWMKMYLKGKNNNPVIYSGIGTWDAKKRTCVPSGYGRQSVNLQGEYVTKYLVADESTYKKGGPAVVFSRDGSEMIYIKNGQQSSIDDEYRTLLYENRKASIKQRCIEQNIKFVENVEVGGDIYSGGWKDACPYLYGASYNDVSVFVGNFDCKNNGTNYSWRLKDNYEYYFNNKRQPHNKRQHPFIEESKVVGTDTIYSKFDEFTYMKYVKNNKNEYASYIILDYGTADDCYAEILKPKSDTQKGEYWGINMNEESLFEGYMYIKNGKILRSEHGVTLYRDGEVSVHMLEQEHRIYSYPDGSQFESFSEYNPKDNAYAWPGVYTFTDGNYVVGYFSRQRGRADQNRRFNNFDPSYTEEYNSSGQLVNSTMVDAKWDTEEHNKAITKMRNYYSRPDSGYYEYIYEDGGVYIGMWENKKRNGNGRFKSHEGDVYEGQWKNDQFIQGQIIFTNGKIEEGAFINGKLNGQGKRTCSTGEFEEGTFANGILNGQGKRISAKGSILEGFFVNGRLNGQGKISYPSGGIWDGIWKNGDFVEGTRVWGNDSIVGKFKGDYGFLISGYIQIGDSFRITSSLWTSSGETGNNELRYPCIPEREFNINFRDIIFNGIAKSQQLWGNYKDVKKGFLYKGWLKNDSINNEIWRPINSGEIIFENGDTIIVTFGYAPDGQHLMLPNSDFIYKWADGRTYTSKVNAKGNVERGTYFLSSGNKASKKEYSKWEKNIVPDIKLVIPHTSMYVIKDLTSKQEVIKKSSVSVNKQPIKSQPNPSSSTQRTSGTYYPNRTGGYRQSGTTGTVQRTQGGRRVYRIIQ